MAIKEKATAGGKKAYPMSVSVFMVCAAIVISFVDLAFLNDVIGKVLDFGSTESMLTAFVLGLVGIGIMAHQGVREAHEDVKRSTSLGHYSLWVLLGLTFVAIRFFSASVLQLDESLGDQSLLNVLGLKVREIDLVLAPLMFILYIATGIMMKDGIKNLLSNSDFDDWWASWQKARKIRKAEEDARKAAAEAQRNKEREEEKARLEEIAKAREQARIDSALHGSYGNALKQYREKENEIKGKYQISSSNIDYVKNIDKQEREFEIRVKPSLMRIVEEAIHSAQNSTALAIRGKAGGDISEYRDVIKQYNDSRNEK